jgi:hypothetical protein
MDTMELAVDNDELDHFTLLANKRASCSESLCYKEVSRTGTCIAVAGPESTQAGLAKILPVGVARRICTNCAIALGVAGDEFSDRPSTQCPVNSEMGRNPESEGW